jgi:hypothetical protein
MFKSLSYMRADCSFGSVQSESPTERHCSWSFRCDTKTPLQKTWSLFSKPACLLISLHSFPLQSLVPNAMFYFRFFRFWSKLDQTKPNVHCFIRQVVMLELKEWKIFGFKNVLSDLRFPLTFRNPASYIKDGHTATFNTPHFLYFFNKYTYWNF